MKVDSSSSSVESSNDNSTHHSAPCTTKVIANDFAQLKVPVPWKLWQLLQDSDERGNEHIVSWLPEGDGFAVYKVEDFTALILRSYFPWKDYETFKHELGRYGFTIRDMGDMDVYRHKRYNRNNKNASLSVRRRSVSRGKLAMDKKNATKRESFTLKHGLNPFRMPRALSAPLPNRTADTQPNQEGSQSFIEANYNSQCAVPSEIGVILDDTNTRLDFDMSISSEPSLTNAQDTRLFALSDVTDFPSDGFRPTIEMTSSMTTPNFVCPEPTLVNFFSESDPIDVSSGIAPNLHDFEPRRIEQMVCCPGPKAEACFHM